METGMPLELISKDGDKSKRKTCHLHLQKQKERF